MSPASDTQGVMVTGICGRLGRRLARALHRRTGVIGVDGVPFADPPKDLEHHQLDLRSKRVRDLFKSSRVSALVHLGVVHDPHGKSEQQQAFNAIAMSRLLEYVEEFAIPKVILLSSGNVYGPRPDNPQFLTEEAPLLAAGRFSDIRDLIELDMMAQSSFWRQHRTETVILRPSHILGTVRNAPSNYLRLKFVPTLLGFDPMVQVVHQDDVVQAIVRALEPGIRGIFNLAGPPPVALSKAIELLGRSPVPVPYSAAHLLVDRLFRLRVTSFPAPELDFIRYVCMVDDSQARRVLGYAPVHDLKQTLSAVDDERWLD